MRTRLTLILNFLISVVLAAILTTSASAGDFADREIIGFSQNGSVFAFEEYGVQDGSGFPYSNIYIVDTANDRWINGSPFRVRIDDETAGIEEARNQARQQADNALNGIYHKGLLAASNPHTEVSPDPYRIVARPRSYIPSGLPNLELKLDVYEVFGQDYCSLGGALKAFRLLLISQTDGIATRLIHDDGNSVPKSRNCPLDYQFADIITYHPDAGGMVAIALVRVWSLGFEGPDGRYIAIPFTTD